MVEEVASKSAKAPADPCSTRFSVIAQIQDGRRQMTERLSSSVIPDEQDEVPVVRQPREAGLSPELLAESARAASDRPAATEDTDGAPIAIASQKAHVRFAPRVCEGCGQQFVPEREAQRHHNSACRAAASPQRKSVRMIALLDRLDPGDPGRPE